MNIVLFVVLLLPINLIFLLFWVNAITEIPVIKKRMLDPKNRDAPEYAYKINSELYKNHKKKWSKYYLIPFFVYNVPSILLAVLFHWYDGYADCMFLGLIAVFVVAAKESKEKALMEKEVRKMYAEEKTRLYDERQKG